MHHIDFSNSRANVAFVGDRSQIWHRLGTQKVAGASIDSWAIDAGLDWQAIMVPAIADLSALHFKGLPPSVVVSGDKYIVRNDTGGVLGHVSDTYKPVQPRDVLEWFERYISVDPRFQLDVAGSLKGGRIIWATATFNGELDIAGDKHVARILMTTTFDGTAATINQGTMTRVVCNNTLNVALSDDKAVVKTRHNAHFDPERVSRELARIAEGFDAYKSMAEAMAKVELRNGDISKFFKKILDIPFDAKEDEVSTRKMNQFKALSESYKETVREGTEANTGWTALNAVTRWVDHDRSTKTNGESVEAGRFYSAQFGSGASIKADAVEVLKLLAKEHHDHSFVSVSAGSDEVAKLLASAE